jgi:hypothetical protein
MCDIDKPSDKNNFLCDGSNDSVKPSDKNNFLCDEYCSHKTHPFLYKLNSKERKYIQTVAHNNIYMNSKYDFSKETTLSGLIMALDDHFAKNPDNEYFLRLNKLSPKDAYYFMEDIDSDDEGGDTDTDMTVDTIKRDIEYLHVSRSTGKMTEHCLNVLLHSDRVYCEIAFDDDESTELSVLLLDYVEVNHKSETRCYVHRNKLVAISQYYCDLTDTYDNPENIKKSIKEFFDNTFGDRANMKITKLESFVFDIYFDSQGIVHLIELNPFNHATDSCLFTWTELDEVINTSIFRYKRNDKVISFI